MSEIIPDKVMAVQYQSMVDDAREKVIMCARNLSLKQGQLREAEYNLNRMLERLREAEHQLAQVEARLAGYVLSEESSNDRGRTGTVGEVRADTVGSGFSPWDQTVKKA